MDRQNQTVAETETETPIAQVIELRPRKPVAPPRTDLERLLDTFIDQKGRKHKHANFYISDNRLLHRTWAEGGERITNVALRVKKSETESLVIGNSSILPYIESRMAWGSFRRNRGQTKIQSMLESRVAMLPFTAFEQSNLNLSNIKILDQSGAEEVSRKNREYSQEIRDYVEKLVQVHFTGASLFEVDGKYFLFDIDREEIQHGIFNPFIAEIPVAVKTIAEAYRALKPKEVLAAEKKGLEVLRQGEWFFIPSKAPKFSRSLHTKLKKLQKLREGMSYTTEWTRRQEVGDQMAKIQSKVPAPMSLQAGNNRPNDCEQAIKIGKVTYCTGKVTHRGREHRDLELKRWYTVVPNTATRSFQITGDVD